jgi:hypothetical protein
MSSVPAEPDPLEETLESTRRSIRQLEMDTYRVRTDLTRLEVALESVKNRDAGAVAEDTSALDWEPPTAEGFGAVDLPSRTIDSREAAVAPTAFEENFDVARPNEQINAHDFASFPDSADGKLDAPNEDSLAGRPVISKGAGSAYKLATPPVVASLALHGAMILAIVSITVAAVVRSEPSFTTTFSILAKSRRRPPRTSI